MQRTSTFIAQGHFSNGLPEDIMPVLLRLRSIYFARLQHKETVRLERLKASQRHQAKHCSPASAA
jgi:hypothetical protein